MCHSLLNSVSSSAKCGTLLTSQDHCTNWLVDLVLHLWKGLRLCINTGKSSEGAPDREWGAGNSWGRISTKASQWKARALRARVLRVGRSAF